MHYAIDDTLLARLKALATSDPINADLVESITTAEASPLIEGLYWTMADLLEACRMLLGQGTQAIEDGEQYYARRPFRDGAREKLALDLAGGPELFLPGVHDEVESEMAAVALERIQYEVERAAKCERVPKRTLKSIMSDSHAITAAVNNLSDEAIAGGMMVCAKSILDELMRAFAENPEQFRKAARSRAYYRDRDDDEFMDDW
jgi:hypothetical protein